MATLNPNSRRVSLFTSQRLGTSNVSLNVTELLRTRAQTSSYFKNMQRRKQRDRFQRMAKDAVELDRLNRSAWQFNDWEGRNEELGEYINGGIIRRSKERRSSMRKERLEMCRMKTPRKASMDIVSDVQSVKDNVPPIVKFRRSARAVYFIVQVCQVCRELMAYSVMQEKWYALVGNMAATGTGENNTNKPKSSRPFVALIPDERNKKLIQLTFDANVYRRDYTDDGMAPPHVRAILNSRPGTRSNDNVLEVNKFMKMVSEPFKAYSIETQKKICQLAFYDRYTPNRVILRRGLPADGFYIVMAGNLAEHDPEKKKPREITVGCIFGEYDLLCGCKRRTTVVTTSMVDLLYIHRLDYRKIFNIRPDCHHPSQLDICSNNLIFRHFPMQRLADNPGTWSVLKYKFGQLMVKDSNDIDWVYVIKSGEARVLKKMDQGMVDFKARRRRNQSEADMTQKKQTSVWTFVANQSGISPRYNSATSSGLPSPRTSLSSSSRLSHTVSLPAIRLDPNPDYSDDNVFVNDDNNDVCAEEAKEVWGEMEETETPENEDLNLDLAAPPFEEENNDTTLPDLFAPRGILKSEGEKMRNSKQLRISLDLRPETKSSRGRSDKVLVPPFLQIESLHQGSVFGLRACLDEEEFGPSVSLVSSGCEVLQINKKFFQRHIDEAVASLIRLKCPPYPTQEELLRRLDSTFLWKEHRVSILNQSCAEIETRRRRSKYGRS